MGPKKNKSQLSQVSYVSPNKRARKENKDNYLYICLRDSGLTLKDPPEKNCASRESIQIIRNIKKNLESHFDYPRNVGELFENLQIRCQDMDIFKHYLFPNIVFRIKDNSEEQPSNDSVIKILLSVLILQPKLCDYIFEKATDQATQSSLEQWIQIILKCFSSLDHIVDSEKMAMNLINLLEITSEKMVRLKIITAIPDIIGDQQHNNIAMEISRILNEDHDLIPAILDCLIYLNLSNEEQDHLQKQSLNILKSLTKCNYFPNFVKFLLMPSRLNENGCLAAIDGLRKALGWSTLTMSSEDIASSQVLTAAAIRSTMIASKLVANTWLKVISQCKTSIEHKSIDFIILLILYSTSEDRQKQVESLVKKHVKSDVLRNDLVDEVFDRYKPILREYLKNLTDLAKAFLKSNGEMEMELFSSHIYVLMFKELEDCHPTIIAELLQHGLNSKQCVSSILTTLNYVFNINKSLLKHQSLQILSLLDRMDDMELAEVRATMNLLCGLAYGIENSFIKDDMHMIIRKELSSSNPKIKVQGILAGVHAVKYLMIEQTLENLEEQSHTKNSNAICHLPEGNLKEAAQIIELISQSIKQFSDMIAFFYDELSQIISTADYINPHFLSWITNAATNDWIQNFIVDRIENEIITGIKLIMEYGLNDDNEVIAINIAGITLQHDAEISMNILSPLFQLVQSLHFKQNNGDLSSIDALLGCPIIMPKFDIDNIEDLDQSLVSSILDCLIYSVNWFIELVNAFSIQSNDSLKTKTLKRVLNIEELQLNITEIISKCKNLIYKSPTSLLNIKKYTSDFKSRKITKSSNYPPTTSKQKKCPDIVVETLRSQATQLPTSVKSRLDTLNSISFRQININILLLLKSQSFDKDYNIKLTNFVLKCGNDILQRTMLSKIKKNTFLCKQESFAYDPKKALEYAEKVNEILPIAMAHLETITKYLQNNILENQSNDNEIIYTPELINYITGLEQIYKMLTTHFRWIGFKNHHNALLKTSLKKVVNSNNDKAPLKDILLNVANVFKYHKKYCLQLSTAVSLVELLNSIQTHSNNQNMLQIVKELSHNFLSQSWKTLDGVPEKGLTFNQNIDFLASIYFINNEILDLKTMSLELAHDIKLLESKNDTLRGLKCINKVNFPIIFRNLGTAVFEAAKRRLDKGMTNPEHLVLWRDIADILKSMTEIVKTQKSNSLTAFFKKSMPILRLFTLQGIPILKLEFKNQTDEVLQILKILQQSTRFLHSLCCHSRLKKNKALLSKVPFVKKILETLIYQVKAALAANNCSEAFWMGNLKNKDIHGEVIASQESIDEEESLEDGDEQLLSDDDDCDNIDDELLNPESKSLSDII